MDLPIFSVSEFYKILFKKEKKKKKEENSKLNNKLSVSHFIPF